MRFDIWLLVILTGGFYVSALRNISLSVKNSSGNAVELKSSSIKCEEKSEAWNDTAALKLNSICDPLSYEYKSDFCFIEDDEKLECLRNRALMHDMKSCDCFRPKSNHRDCIYVEVCLFTAPDFVCNDNYSCTVNDSDHAVNCVSSTGQPSVKSFCHAGSSFIHSSPEYFKLCRSMIWPQHFRNIFKDLCLTENVTSLLEKSTWYYLDRIHFDNSNYTFGGLAPILLAENDKDNKCIKKDPCDASVTVVEAVETPPWKIALPTLAVIIVLISVSLAIWKCRTRYLKEEGEWKEFMKKSIKSSVLESSPTREPYQRPPEVMSTEICLPVISVNETITTETSQSSSDDNEIAEQTGPSSDGYERLLDANEGHTSLNTATAFDNVSYRLQRPIESESIVVANSGEYSAPSAEIFDPPIVVEFVPAPNSGEYSSH